MSAEDWILGYDVPDIEQYLTMTDEELRKATAGCRSEKLKSIRKWPGVLSGKQRYCLAAWLAKRDEEYS